MIKGIERTKDGADTLIDKTRDLVLEGTDRAEHRIEDTAGRVVERSHVAAQALREGTVHASQRAHQRVGRAAETADRVVSKTRADLSRLAEDATAYVARNPGKSLLMAAAAGFLVGLVVRRRRRLA